MLDFCENGVRDAQVTAQVILDCMYHFAAEKNALAGQKDKNLLRPYETFHQYNTALHTGKIDEYLKGTTLATLLLDDLARRAQNWRKEKGVLPDENTDEAIDSDHPPLPQITWKKMATLIKNNQQYGFSLSEEWQNRGLAPVKTPDNPHDLNRIDAALPKAATKTNPPEDTSWRAKNHSLRRTANSSLPREFRKTALIPIKHPVRTIERARIENDENTPS